MKQRIISIVVQNHEYRFAASRICKRSELSDDLFQEMVLALCEMDECKLIALYEKEDLPRYIVGMLYRMWNYPTSEFYKRFRKTQTSELVESFADADLDNYNIEIDKASADIITKLQSMQHGSRGDWFNAKMFELYMNNGQSARKLNKLTGIPRTTIQRAVDQAKAKLKADIKINE